MARANDPSGLENALVGVWRAVLLEGAREVRLGKETYAVRRTAKKGLAQVDFELDGTPYRGLEQNPKTKSRWAEIARKGAKVMQFLSGGRYIGVVVDGKVTHYKEATGKNDVRK